VESWRYEIDLVGHAYMPVSLAKQFGVAERGENLSVHSRPMTVCPGVGGLRIAGGGCEVGIGGGAISLGGGAGTIN
jgi:hypothetical protein